MVTAVHHSSWIPQLLCLLVLMIRDPPRYRAQQLQRLPPAPSWDTAEHPHDTLGWLPQLDACCGAPQSSLPLHLSLISTGIAAHGSPAFSLISHCTTLILEAPGLDGTV